MYEIGRLWEGNEITVAQEHVATALMPSLMAYCYRRAYPSASPKKGLVALVGVTGELHDLGLQILRDILEAHQWRVSGASGVLQSAEGLLQALEAR